MTQIQPYNEFDFDLISDGAVRGVTSENSKRVYANTYSKWHSWCLAQNVHPLHLSGDNVERFLSTQLVSFSSRKNYLSHIKKLVEYLTGQDDRFEQLYRQISFIKISDSGTVQSKRTKTFMTPSQVQRVMGYWLELTTSDRPALIYRRNHAMMTVMFGTGARRSEIATLRWTDFNFEDGLVKFRKRKGGKSDTIPYLGQFVTDTLLWWKAFIPGNKYLFSPITPDGNNILADKPISDDVVYQTVKAMCGPLNINIAPHDLRRTLATELGRNGVDLQHIQKMMGHASSTTTRIYMEDIEALELRDKLVTRWAT